METPIGTKRYRTITWQDSYGARRWHYIIRLYRRSGFKRSGRVGWRGMGFVGTNSEASDFSARNLAVAASKDEIKRLKTSDLK